MHGSLMLLTIMLDDKAHVECPTAALVSQLGSVRVLLPVPVEKNISSLCISLNSFIKN